ncbi:hypothetical protein V1505DRAFT_357310 [Lipomyces doorenjongii]
MNKPTAAQAQAVIVEDGRKPFKSGANGPERQSDALPLRSLDMARWKELARRCMLAYKAAAQGRFRMLMKQQVEHLAYLEKAPGIEVEMADLMSIREDVYELEKHRPTAQAEKLGRQFAMLQYVNFLRSATKFPNYRQLVSFRFVRGVVDAYLHVLGWQSCADESDKVEDK